MQHPLDRTQLLLDKLTELTARPYSKDLLETVCSVHQEFIERIADYRENGDPTPRQKESLRAQNDLANKLFRDFRKQAPAPIVDLQPMVPPIQPSQPMPVAASPINDEFPTAGAKRIAHILLLAGKDIREAVSLNQKDLAAMVKHDLLIKDAVTAVGEANRLIETVYA